MGKLIKKFKSHLNYETNLSEEILYNVSLCKDEYHLHYDTYIFDPFNGHDYVDLGLPSGTKWATMNVGASSETDYGLFFQCGDTQGYTASQVGSDEGQKYFGWDDYKYSNNGGKTANDMIKYNPTDGLITLELTDDAVAAAWGGNWRMPTETEFNELLNNTDKEWTTINGVNGYKFTNKNDNTKYIFFPAAGNCDNGSVDDVSSYGRYWSSSFNTSNLIYCKYLYFSSSECGISSYTWRRYGYSVRGVVN